MTTRDIIIQLEAGKELTDEQKLFIKDKWKRKPLVKNEKYGSMRCPNCDDVITYINACYCSQCGQRISSNI